MAVQQFIIRLKRLYDLPRLIFNTIDETNYEYHIDDSAGSLSDE